LFKGLPKGRLISTFLNSFNKTWYDMTAHVISYIRFKSVIWLCSDLCDKQV